jgi:hypothetical protein
MDITAVDDALRDSRRHQLAYKLMAHKVRTRTISAMTGLSREQQRKLRQRWGITERMRPRGSSPVSLSRFTCSKRARSEGASLAAICRAYGVLLPQALAEISRRGPLSLDLAERLCQAYEAFCASFPQGRLQFEDLLNFVLGLADNEIIGLGQCAFCGATVLIDRLDSRQPTCGLCRRERAETRGSK